MDREAPQRVVSETPEEIKVIDGIKYRKVDTGYTIRQYFSHSTLEKGPGPGWDVRFSRLPDLGIDPLTVFKPDDLPNDPYYVLEEVVDEEK